MQMFLIETEKGIRSIRNQIDVFQNEIDKILGKFLIKKRATKKPISLIVRALGKLNG